MIRRTLYQNFSQQYQANASHNRQHRFIYSANRKSQAKRKIFAIRTINNETGMCESERTSHNKKIPFNRIVLQGTHPKNHRQRWKKCKQNEKSWEKRWRKKWRKRQNNHIFAHIDTRQRFMFSLLFSPVCWHICVERNVKYLQSSFIFHVLIHIHPFRKHSHWCRPNVLAVFFAPLCSTKAYTQIVSGVEIWAKL